MSSDSSTSASNASDDSNEDEADKIEDKPPKNKRPAPKSTNTKRGRGRKAARTGGKSSASAKKQKKKEEGMFHGINLSSKDTAKKAAIVAAAGQSCFLCPPFEDGMLVRKKGAGGKKGTIVKKDMKRMDLWLCVANEFFVAGLPDASEWTQKDLAKNTAMVKKNLKHSDPELFRFGEVLVDAWCAYLADCQVRFEQYLRLMVTGGEDTTDVAKARLVLWGDELDEVLKILPKKPVDVVAMALGKDGIEVPIKTIKTYVNDRNVKDAKLAFVLRKLVCPKKPAIEEDDKEADVENSLVLNPDAWAITMFLSIVCCSGSDSVVLTRLQKFASGEKISMYIPSCVRSS